MAVRVVVYGNIHATVSKTADMSTPTAEIAKGGSIYHTYENGTGAGQASKFFSDTRTLAPSTGEDLDLSGSLLDDLGQPFILTAGKTLEIKAAESNVNNLIVGNAAANGWVGPFGAATHTLSIPPGGMIQLNAPAAGWPVVAATADLLHFLNGGAGTPVSYDVFIAGV